MTSYWQGIGTAPGYSREVEEAHNAVRAAKDQLLAALQMHYPVGSTVRIVHYRGSFDATVLGHDTDGTRVVVQNIASGKASKWWAAQVEVISAAPQQQEGPQQ